LYNRKRWTGWELNPRPQQSQELSKTVVLSYIKGRQLLKEKGKKKERGYNSCCSSSY
jgi:hypothetical protein